VKNEKAWTIALLVLVGVTALLGVSIFLDVLQEIGLIAQPSVEVECAPRGETV
jgi:hypothetical protein